ncbi:calmodulin-binding protein 25-like [Miscanthus floridulus]|uniref:calmodulin-binding protein 25-like n=1 Tax=Miscanthus floridulus TaxID=154761 RepID=UPI0034587A56
MDAISCLAPPPAALLATSYTDAAIARALHFSSTTMSPDYSASASSSSLNHHQHSPLLSALADLPSPYYAPPPVPPPHAVAATCCDSVLVADSPRRRSSPTAGARAGKRRSRASKRAPTTYISTDPANFRLMVQQITGVQADAASAGVEVMMLQVQASAALDAAALLGAAAAGNPQLLPAGDEASALRQHQLQQQQPCFPTLDSWNVVMYETNSVEML